MASQARSIVRLIGDGTVDGELAAQLWLLIDGRVPIVVASDDDPAGASMVLAALLDFLPSVVSIVELAGPAESFSWLPQASELGWPGKADLKADTDPVRPDRTVLMAAGLADEGPRATPGAVARIAVRAASIGYGLAATMRAGSLEDVFAALGAGPVGLSDDECSHLGVVLVVRRLVDGRRRVTAAHFVRPIARDVHGHLQRLGPAVIATWDPESDGFEHFGWGVTPELARRVGRHAGDFEIELDRRQAYLDHLLAGGAIDAGEVRDAIRAYRPAEPFDAPRMDA